MYIIEETDTRFEIKKSKIENAGWGCFAKNLIKKGDFLEIIGVLVKPGSLADQCTHYAKRYKFSASDRRDGKVVPMGFGGIVNHTDNKEKQNVFLTYLPRDRQKRSSHSTQVVYMALRDIEAGEELLGHYGDKVDVEIKKFNENIEHLKSYNDEWNSIVETNIYNLKDIISCLKKD